MVAKYFKFVEICTETKQIVSVSSFWDNSPNTSNKVYDITKPMPEWVEKLVIQRIKLCEK